MAPQAEDYAQYPDHPLCGVPQGILDVARKVMDAAAEWGDVEAEHAHPLADAVVMSLLPWMSWPSDTTP